MPKDLPKTKYVSLYDITELQARVMHFVEIWVHTEKTPIPQKAIIANLKTENGVEDFSTVNAINSLIRKGYLRRAVTDGSNSIWEKTFYVQLRRL